MISEDEQILAQYREQSKEVAFEKIIRKYNRILFAHLGRYLNQPEDIEDTLQLVWIKVWKGLEKFRGESLLSTWLYTIATREAYNFYRNRVVKSFELEEKIQEAATNNDVLLDASGILTKLQEAIDLLPEKQKEVFIMRYFEEKSYSEISAQTGTSEGALKASYHHAVKKIETFINPN